MQQFPSVDGNKTDERFSIGNIEENIVFNRPIDKDKLNKCIESCYLTKVNDTF